MASLGLQYEGGTTVVGQATMPSGMSPQDYPFTQITAVSTASAGVAYPIIEVYEEDANSGWAFSPLTIAGIAVAAVAAAAVVVAGAARTLKRGRTGKESGLDDSDLHERDPESCE
eukprot:scaffold169368_cov40-Prasinocladus_malaysianus.AAC.1